MNVIEHHRFGAVDAYRFGFGPFGPPLMSVFLYFVDDLLVDTALSNMSRQVLSVAGELHPRRVLLTHHHEDHSGNAAALKAAWGVDVIGHPLTAAKMKKTGRILPYQHLVWGRARGLPVSPFCGPIVSERITLTPIHTPGHSKDHTVYLEKEQGWLFSGDLYLGEVRHLRNLGASADQIARRLGNGSDRKVKWVTLGNASFANMVRSALRAV